MFEKLMSEKDWYIQMAIGFATYKNYKLAALYFHAAEGLQKKAYEMTIGEING